MIISKKINLKTNDLTRVEFWVRKKKKKCWKKQNIKLGGEKRTKYGKNHPLLVWEERCGQPFIKKKFKNEACTW